MSGRGKYVLDADSLIRAKREHYAHDFCPGFWDALVDAFRRRQQVCSIEQIESELKRGNDSLAEWVVKKAPSGFFVPPAAQDEYREIVEWIHDEPRFPRAEKNKFLGGADPWLLAFARVSGRCVVTYEVPSGVSSKRIKIPDVAKHFGIEFIAPYSMLRRLGVCLNLA